MRTDSLRKTAGLARKPWKPRMSLILMGFVVFKKSARKFPQPKFLGCLPGYSPQRHRCHGV